MRSITREMVTWLTPSEDPVDCRFQALLQVFFHTRTLDRTVTRGNLKRFSAARQNPDVVISPVNVRPLVDIAGCNIGDRPINASHKHHIRYIHSASSPP